MLTNRFKAQIVLVALLALLAVGGVVAAQEPGQEPGAPPTWSWSEFLYWASSPTGVPILAGGLLSWVVEEYIPGWQPLAPKWKRAAFFGITMIVPLLAAGLGVLTDGWPASWALTFWPAILTGFVAFGSGTMTHLLFMNKRAG